MQEAVHPDNLRTVCSPTVLAIVAIMASVGMVTGYFLKVLDSVLKSVASAVEVPYCALCAKDVPVVATMQYACAM